MNNISSLLFDPFLSLFDSNLNSLNGANNEEIEALGLLDTTQLLEEELKVLEDEESANPGSTGNDVEELQMQLSRDVSMLENLMLDNNTALFSSGLINSSVTNTNNDTNSFAVLENYLAETNVIAIAGSIFDQAG